MAKPDHHRAFSPEVETGILLPESTPMAISNHAPDSSFIAGDAVKSASVNKTLIVLDKATGRFIGYLEFQSIFVRWSKLVSHLATSSQNPEQSSSWVVSSIAWSATCPLPER